MTRYKVYEPDVGITETNSEVLFCFCYFEGHITEQEEKNIDLDHFVRLSYLYFILSIKSVSPQCYRY